LVSVFRKALIELAHFNTMTSFGARYQKVQVIIGDVLFPITTKPPTGAQAMLDHKFGGNERHKTMKAHRIFCPEKYSDSVSFEAQAASKRVLDEALRQVQDA